jgi:ADP-heptose:LPS heptosyltransferase
LIRISDCFIGYDSCGQHIATAAGTPSVIIFAGAPSARFVARWSPNNPAGATIPLYRNSELGDRERAGLLKKVTEAVAQVREKAGA